MRACACCIAGLCVAAVVHEGFVNTCVCVCAPRLLTLCSLHSKLIRLLSRLDEKGPRARGAHCISRWESPLCSHHTAFLITGHAQWAAPRTPPLPPRACLNQSVRGGGGGGGGGAALPSLVSHVTFKARRGDSRLTGEEGRRGVFLQALWATGLICHSLFPLCAFAQSQPPEKRATA